MKIYLNNQETNIEPDWTLEELMLSKEWHEKTGIAVALNGAVIPKTNWKISTIKENDSLMIITATAGG